MTGNAILLKGGRVFQPAMFKKKPKGPRGKKNTDIPVIMFFKAFL
jgi:hypothetical protein